MTENKPTRGGSAEVTVTEEHVATTSVSTLDWNGADWKQALDDYAPALVEYSAGCTLQDEMKYEMARFDVRVTMPCDAPCVDACFKDVRKWVDRRLGEIKARHRKRVAGE